MRSNPPIVARLLLRLFVRGEGNEFVAGDLNEEYRRYVLPSVGFLRAHRWYWSQALRTIVHYRTTSSEPKQRASEIARGDRVVSAFILDLRFAIRTLGRAPGFATLVILTLGLGIGANTAIFSVVNDVMLRPLTFADSGRLVMLWESNAERGWTEIHAAPANVEDWRERVSAFADVATLNDYVSTATLTGMDEPLHMNVGIVSGNLFTVLGVPPTMGRTFVREETWADGSPVVLLSHAVWQRVFGEDPEIVGRSVLLDGESFEVIGVMPAGFKYEFNDAEIWITHRWTADRRASVWFRQAHVVRAVARLVPAVTVEQAHVELEGVGLQLQTENPRLNRAMEAGLTRLDRYLVGDRRLPLMLLLGAVGLLLMIACANVANLLLVRAVGRRQELAVRCALGAGRGRVARQLLTESAVIAVGGAMLGVAIAAGLVRWMASLQPPNFPALEFRLDWRVLAFALGVTGGSALFFSVMPVLRTVGLDAMGGLREGSRGGSPNRAQQRSAGMFASFQVAVAMMLVVGAGLMVRTLVGLRSVDTGVDPSGVLTLAISPPRGSYPSDRDRADFFVRFVERVRAIPGVEDAGAIRTLAMQGGGWTSDFTMDGWGPDRFGIEVKHREASPGYFRVMNIPVLAGELFPARLGPEESVPVLVNRAFVDRYFPDESPVGRRITFDRLPSERSYWYTIWGVVGNERASAFGPPEPEILAHLRGDVPNTARIAIKTTVDQSSIVPLVREALTELDGDIPMVEVQPMTDVVSAASARENFLVNLFGVFGVLGLGLACVGVYGVAAQAARSRTREIGIRMALGASGSNIVREFLRRAAVTVTVGLAVGLAASLAGTRVMAGLLYGVQPTDPITFVTVSALLGGMVFVSSYLPARRASGVDPVAVLRTD